MRHPPVSGILWFAHEGAGIADPMEPYTAEGWFPAATTVWGSKVSSIPPDFFHHQAIFTDESMI